MMTTLRINFSDHVLEAPSLHNPRNYSVLSSNGFNIMGGIFASLTLLSFLSNGCVLLVFITNQSLQSATNFFIISLCVSDLLMSLCSSVACAASFQHGWVFGEAICKTEGFFVFFLGLTSMYLLAAISVDRYIVIVKPILGAKITKGVSLIVIFMCWGLGFLWAALPLVGWNHYTTEGVGISCSVIWHRGDLMNLSYIISIFIFCLVFPLCLMLFSYVSIYLTIRRMARNSVWSAKSRMARKNQRIERKMLKTTIILVLVYVGSWLPYTVASFTASFGPPGVISPLMATLPALFAKLSGLWNPMIYVATNAQYRKAFKEFFRCCEIVHRSRDSDDCKTENSSGNVKSSRYYSPAETTTLDEDKPRVIPNYVIQERSNESTDDTSIACALPNGIPASDAMELSELCPKNHKFT